MSANLRAATQESLLRLYLRLNGFFYAGFIAHSPSNGRVRTEVDALAIRFPLHSERERVIEDDPSLQLSSSHLELAICEVKSLGQKLRFNEALYSSTEAIDSILRRVGLFSPDEVQGLVKPVQQALTPQAAPQPVVPVVDAPAILEPRKIRIRGLMFSPERESVRTKQPWFIGPQMIFPFITSCLSPEIPRLTCAVNYGAGQWAELAPVVDYFKTKPAGEPGNMQELYRALGI